MSGFGAAQRRQLRNLRRIFPTILPEREHHHTVPCQQCGKLIAAADGAMGPDKGILCKERYDNLHAAKDQAKE